MTDPALAKSANRIAWIGGIVTLVAYALIARGVENFYPFSVFSMYAEQDSDSMSRLGARGRDGVMHDVEAFDHWHCNDADPLRTTSAHSFDYINRESRDYVAAHTASQAFADAEPVELVRREWHFVAGQSPIARDIVITTCEASRGGAGSSAIAIDALHPPRAATTSPH